MWYLSRTPHLDPNTQPKGPSNLAFRNSIFSVSDTGLFEEISIVDIPKSDHKDKQSQSQTCTGTGWEWFAYVSSLSQFHAVAVPRNMSMTIQMIAVLPERFLCAKLSPAPRQHGTLCTYCRDNNTWQDIPKMQWENRNPIAASGALLGGWLYLAGGYQGNPSYVDPSTYLNSAERLNLETWEWQALPPMHNARAFATGIAHKGKFYVVGGANSKHSAEIYNPASNSWHFLKSFVPKEAEGFAMTSMCGGLVTLTWSDQLDIKLWLWIEVVNAVLIGGWRLISFFPNNAVERVRFKPHGARMVRVGKEVWVLVGENDRVCHVDGSGGWPVFPAPSFRPSVMHDELERKGHICAFSFQVDGRICWRQIPIYVIQDLLTSRGNGETRFYVIEMRLFLFGWCRVEVLGILIF